MNERQLAHTKMTRLLVATASLVALGSMPAPAAAGFCDEGVARDYARPLERMPALRGVPASHRLPFGPDGVGLFRGNQSQVMVPLLAPGRVGFAVAPQPVRAGAVLPDLDWLATVKLARVDSGGRVVRLLDWGRRRIRGGRGSGGAAVDFAGARGFYRLEIVFRNGRGAKLGRFGEYFRVLPASTEARLVLNAASYRPGETISACLENLGTTPLSYHLVRAIESFDGSAWTRSPIDPPAPSALVGFTQGPGAAEPLGDFTIPADAPAGRYRWVWRGGVEGVRDPDATLTLTAEFDVAP